MQVQSLCCKASNSGAYVDICSSCLVTYCLKSYCLVKSKVPHLPDGLPVRLYSVTFEYAGSLNETGMLGTDLCRRDLPACA